MKRLMQLKQQPVQLSEIADAILVWKQIGQHAMLQSDMSSTKSLKLITYAHSSKEYKFVLGQGFVGRCMEGEIGNRLFAYTKNLKRPEFYHLKEALMYDITQMLFIKLYDDVIIELDNVDMNFFTKGRETDVTKSLRKYYDSFCEYDKQKIDPYFFSDQTSVSVCTSASTSTFSESFFRECGTTIQR